MTIERTLAWLTIALSVSLAGCERRPENVVRPASSNTTTRAA